MRVLSLFSGIGAHDLGLEWAGMKIVGQVEIDEYCQSILAKHWPKVKRWSDITTVPINDLRRLKPDLITGGFPCQDISTAGAQAGIVEGAKSSLWRELWRVVRGVRPHWVLIENVIALRTKGADGVLSSLEALGYTCWPLVVGAIHVGATHERRRSFIVAHSQDAGLAPSRITQRITQAFARSANSGLPSGELPRSAMVAATSVAGLRSHRFPLAPGQGQHEDEPSRTAKSRVGSELNGTARTLALKALGNANPPQVVAMIGRAIMHANKLLNET